MAVSYLRPASDPGRTAQRTHKRLTSQPRRLRPVYFVLGALILVIGAVAAGALVIVSSHASLTPASDGLANIGMPLGGGTVQSVKVTGPHGKVIPVDLRGDPTIWPKKKIPAHTKVSITVMIKRPGWNAWLAGKTERLHTTMVTPSATLVHHYMTVRAGDQLKLQFKDPVSAIWYGPEGHVTKHPLASPQSTINVPHNTPAGTLEVAAAPRAWETAAPAVISWFPPGSGTSSAVASPAPGTQIRPDSPLTLTFQKPVSKALGNAKPAISPATLGTWETVNSHTIRFVPSGYGYGLAAPVSVGLPNDVRLVGGQTNGSAMTGHWTVPAGSTLRLQELLSFTGYLPFTVNYAGKGVPLTPLAQESAAINPPKATLGWKYPNVPDGLRSQWQPGAAGVITRGAVMAFETDHDMTADGVAGPAVWKSLINDVVSGKKSSFGYTFVSVSEGSPESLNLWHNGKTVFTTAVNTGIPAAPTATGTYPVFEHLTVTTMTGENPDGSHYSDPGIPWVSYFNGGDALHGFIRGSYGFPQSLGCVEMPYSAAGTVYPYTPIGTLVDVT
jgi:peptidoglycan hydrolase-like protein with peptidoglycan-binding domain